MAVAGSGGGPKVTASQLAFESLSVIGAAWARPQAVAPSATAPGCEFGDELAVFRQRLLGAGLSASTAIGYGERVRHLVRAAGRIEGRALSVRDVFLNPALLAAAASDPIPLVEHAEYPRLSRRTVASRRIAARSFVRVMDDWLGRDADELTFALEEEIRHGCSLVCRTFRVRGVRSDGRPQLTPTAVDIKTLLRRAGESQRAFLPARNLAFMYFLAATGLRRKSVIGIAGDDFIRSGPELWVMVREKGKREAVPIRVTPELEQVLQWYVHGFNSYVTPRHLPTRIGFGVPGAFWRSIPDTPWTAKGASKLLCYLSRAGAPIGTHAIRRFVAQELNKFMSRSGVADAMRWETARMFDEHYAPRPGQALPGAAEGSGMERSLDVSSKMAARP